MPVVSSAKVSSMAANLLSQLEALASAYLSIYSTQRLQYPLIEEYTLNHISDPTIISGMFLN